MTDRSARRYLLADHPVDFESWKRSGGGAALERALAEGPAAVIDEIRQAGLRGRGGAGFPTGVKWSGVADRADDQPAYLVCNAAEGEPGTFKDRALVRANPYQLLEGIAVAAFALGAERAYIGIKAAYDHEIERIRAAAAEMETADLLGSVPVEIVPGPGDYLLGEEKALLEVIEGRDPLPRQLPPYLLGLHSGLVAGVGSGSVGGGGRHNPTVVNNVETLSHVPHILANGSGWFRSIGTADAPGTMVFTVSGDVRTETVVELPMGTPLSMLLHGFGGGGVDGRAITMVFPGASNAPVGPASFDVPMDFRGMASVGSGLGSGGMIVGDETACPVASAGVLMEFLARESCGQCPPCSLGTAALAESLGSLDDRTALDEMSAWMLRVTDANRCGLGAGGRALAEGVLRVFGPHVVDHVEGRCGATRALPLAALVDHLPEAGRFVRAGG